MSRRLALFDLDNTLLSGDSDHAFGEFLIEAGLVDSERHRSSNDRFYRDYEAGKLDIHSYVRFTLGPVLEMSAAERARLQAEFSESVIRSLASTKSKALVEAHREAGDYTVIITATNVFVTELIARHYDVHMLLATELTSNQDRYTGEIEGIPCYQDGKVRKLQQWLDANAEELGLSLANSIFYSDSSNDVPLLERVQEPVVVDADAKLTEIANARGWRQMSLNREP